ncbi:tRNA uridine(34) 5-carboxymethylaminomethyl modification radical SAM/GNAT enzyme Elp3 [Desulfurococcaceae archaeon MEX13E-LK6-19]|nr:tRNA uridine(34) 5-carboxymethylaminomethyl modification radical SAM/GNAT enzyme Elp3 [Desulfurococcaceae archaeon MEX13E-LK6-19]
MQSIVEAKQLLASRKRPSRTLSGVTIVAIMSKPYPCPHGKCIYCPGGPEFGTPQSYIGEEPALMRAQRVGFDPYEQVRVRLKQYEYLGHKPSKVELIIMGGTFTAMPRDYQEWFIAMALEAMNRYPEPKPQEPVSLQEAQLRNETARIRCIGLTIETRPDWAREEHADWMLYLGATKVEIGVQTIYDDILMKVRRGHTVKDTIEATRILKDSGFKVVYHIMPGLPGSDPDKDLEMIKTIFEDPDYRPDMLKIYPTVVVKGTVLYEWWREGKYKPLSDEEAIELISEMYRYIPKYVRVMRIQRDIPATIIEAGPKKGNLRELVEKRCLEKGVTINEIRFREVGRQLWKFNKLPDPKYTRITRTTYEASKGIEEFLAVEDTVNNIIIGFLRLRIPSEKAHRPEIDGRTAIIRELHIYGPQVPVGEKPLFEWQHQGWGSKLLREAERIAREEYGMKKILVLSGIGVREYYRKHGYYRPSNSPYMHKDLVG